MSETVNILLTCVGRRVALLEAFRRALRDLDVRGRIYGADQSPLAPGFYAADEGILVSPVEGPGYVEELIDVCRRCRIGLLIPLIDWELPALADARDRFAAIGTRVAISSPQVVRVCRDKQQTFEFLRANGFATPLVLSLEAARHGPFPLFMKPRFGSSAKDVHYVADLEALEFYHARGTETVIQEYVRGKEHTVDVYAGFDGVARVAVPRRRLEVRGGEVSKAVTVRHGEVIRQSMSLVNTLRECVGVITLQCFVTDDGQVKFIEINPRFGGGVPLAIEAGANLPRWLVEEHLGRKPQIDPEAWQDGLVMLRYDAAIFRRMADLPDPDGEPAK